MFLRLSIITRSVAVEQYVHNLIVHDKNITGIVTAQQVNLSWTDGCYWNSHVIRNAT